MSHNVTLVTHDASYYRLLRHKIYTWEPRSVIVHFQFTTVSDSITSSLKRKGFRGKKMSPPKASQLSSQWQTQAEKETESEKFMRKSREQPFIPIGKGFIKILKWDHLSLQSSKILECPLSIYSLKSLMSFISKLYIQLMLLACY